MLYLGIKYVIKKAQNELPEFKFGLSAIVFYCFKYDLRFLQLGER